MELQRELELLTKGSSCFDRAEYQKALTILNEVIEINPKNTQAYFLIANIFHLKGQIGKSIKAFSKVLELDPGHTDAAISLSVIYNDIGRYSDAKAIFEKANENVKKKKGHQIPEDPHINKKFALKHFELAELYLTYNRYDEALFEYNKSVGLIPKILMQE